MVHMQSNQSHVLNACASTHKGVEMRRNQQCLEKPLSSVWVRRDSFGQIKEKNKRPYLLDGAFEPKAKVEKYKVSEENN